MRVRERLGDPLGVKQDPAQVIVIEPPAAQDPDAPPTYEPAHDRAQHADDLPTRRREVGAAASGERRAREQAAGPASHER